MHDYLQVFLLDLNVLFIRLLTCSVYCGEKIQADDFLEDILNLEAGLEEADRNRAMDTSSNHQTLPPEVSFKKKCCTFYFLPGIIATRVFFHRSVFPSWCTGRYDC